MPIGHVIHREVVHRNISIQGLNLYISQKLICFHEKLPGWTILICFIEQLPMDSVIYFYNFYNIFLKFSSYVLMKSYQWTIFICFDEYLHSYMDVKYAGDRPISKPLSA